MFKGEKIGLALSGGGALGAAHIGVIEEMEKAGIRPDFVAGVSAGAVIGLAYASGGIEAVKKFYEEINFKFFKKNKYLISGGAAGVFGRVEKILRGLIGEKNFNDLRIPFLCCATNLATGKKEILNSGDCVASVMASAAYPGVFPAQKINGNFYIDGGVTRNLPAEEVREMGADFIIGSSIYAIDEISAAKAGKMNRFEVASRALNILEKELASFEETRCDFCFKPRNGGFQWFDFLKMEEIVDAGRKNAAAQIEDILSLFKKYD